jgi:hypothetical protein
MGKFLILDSIYYCYSLTSLPNLLIVNLYQKNLITTIKPTKFNIA